MRVPPQQVVAYTKELIPILKKQFSNITERKERKVPPKERKDDYGIPTININ